MNNSKYIKEQSKKVKDIIKKNNLEYTNEYNTRNKPNKEFEDIIDIFDEKKKIVFDINITDTYGCSCNQYGVNFLLYNILNDYYLEKNWNKIYKLKKVDSIKKEICKKEINTIILIRSTKSDIVCLQGLSSINKKYLNKFTNEKLKIADYYQKKTKKNKKSSSLKNKKIVNNNVLLTLYNPQIIKHIDTFKYTNFMISKFIIKKSKDIFFIINFNIKNKKTIIKIIDIVYELKIETNRILFMGDFNKILKTDIQMNIKNKNLKLKFKNDIHPLDICYSNDFVFKNTRYIKKLPILYNKQFDSEKIKYNQSILESGNLLTDKKIIKGYFYTK